MACPRGSWSRAGGGLAPGEYGRRAVAGEAELCCGRCSSRRRCLLLLPARQASSVLWDGGQRSRAALGALPLSHAPSQV